MNDSHGVKRVQRTRRRKFNVNGKTVRTQRRQFVHEEDSSYKTKTVHVHDENKKRRGAGDDCHNTSELQQLKLNG